MEKTHLVIDLLIKYKIFWIKKTKQTFQTEKLAYMQRKNLLQFNIPHYWYSWLVNRFITATSFFFFENMYNDMYKFILYNNNGFVDSWKYTSDLSTKNMNRYFTITITWIWNIACPRNQWKKDIITHEQAHVIWTLIK